MTEREVDPVTFASIRRSQLGRLVSKVMQYKDAPNGVIILMSEGPVTVTPALRTCVAKSVRSLYRDLRGLGLEYEAKWIIEDSRQHPESYDPF